MYALLESGLGILATATAIRTATVYTSAVPHYLRILNALWGTAGLWLLIAALSSGIPVVAQISTTLHSFRPGEMVVSVVGNKVRDCQWKQNDAYVVDNKGILYEASLEYVKDIIPGNSRPVGIQSFGTWKITYDKSIAARSVEVYSSHSCELFGAVRTKFPLLAVPENVFPPVVEPSNQTEHHPSNPSELPVIQVLAPPPSSRIAQEDKSNR